MTGPILRRAGPQSAEQRAHELRERRSIAASHDRLAHRQFNFMERAFLPSGGLISGDALASLLRSRSLQPISLLARWIVRREVINFDWGSCTMLPLFQFDLSTMTIRSRVVDVIRELTAAFDDWDLALWFAQPNSWLDNHAPVDVLDLGPRAVFDAARGDCFLTRA